MADFIYNCQAMLEIINFDEELKITAVSKFEYFSSVLVRIYQWDSARKT